MSAFTSLELALGNAQGKADKAQRTMFVLGRSHPTKPGSFLYIITPEDSSATPWTRDATVRPTVRPTRRDP